MKNFNKLTILFLLLIIGLTSNVNAELPPVKQGDCVELKTALNTTGVNLSTVAYPNGTYAVSNKEMTKTGQTFNYTFCDTNTLGLYVYEYYATDYTITPKTNSFEVTYNGIKLTVELTIMYLGLLTLLILFAITVIWFRSKLPEENARSDKGLIIKVVWLKYLRFPLASVVYLCFMGILFLGANLGIAYLNSFIGNVLWYLFLVMGWLIVPLLILRFIVILNNILEDAKIQRWLERGIEVE